MPEMTTEYFY